MNAAFQRLLAVLRQPGALARVDAAGWDGLLRHSRSAGLLSRLALDAREAGLWEALPDRVRRHMRGACFVADRQINAIRWEVHKLHEALGHQGMPIVLLKGAAYVMGDLPPARGRLFGDVDLLLPRDRLDEAERLLHLYGWHGAGLDDYDQRYYREWMHEIPPMTHFSRGSTLDVHHNILPRTARLKPRAEILLAGIEPLPGYTNLYRLGDADLVLHAATHLFHEGEWGHGLRDLVDLDALLRHFMARSGFLAELGRRAAELDLRQPLAYALGCVRTTLGTPLGDPALVAELEAPAHALVRVALGHGFASAHPDLASPGAAAALLFLYVRSHWLKMPPHLLIPHLLHKALAAGEVEKA